MRSVSWGWAAGMAAAAAWAVIGCRGAEAPEAEAGPRSADVSAPAEWIAGTPPGGLEEWVREIREGVRPFPSQAGAGLSEAREAALQLYVGRQEYIEMYYGPGGRLTRGEALGVAVVEAESRFHELMQLLGATPPPDSAAVAAAVAALDAQLERVLSEAQAAGVPDIPEPPVGGGDR